MLRIPLTKASSKFTQMEEATQFVWFLSILVLNPTKLIKSLTHLEAAELEIPLCDLM